MELLLAIRDVGVPDHLPATIEARIDAAVGREIGRGGRSRRRNFGGALSVRRALSATAAIAATVAIVAIVIIAASAHHQAAPQSALKGRASSSQVPAPSTLLPTRGGMQGLLIGVSVVGARSTVRVSFVQCPNCKTSTPPDPKEIKWSAVSTDGGQHWQTKRTRVLLVPEGLAVPEGSNVWADSQSTSGVAFDVSHDSGQTYLRVKADAPVPLGRVTLGDGEAWALGYRCVHHRCGSYVLRGSATGGRLSKTISQPPLPARPITGALEFAGYGHMAYLVESHNRSAKSRDLFYVTLNDGASWIKTPYPCEGNDAVADLSATSDGVVWATCEPSTLLTAPSQSSQRHAEHAAIVRRSVDDGRTWQSPDPDFNHIADLVSASPDVAWAQTPNGNLARTINGGKSWQTVLQGAGSSPNIGIVNGQIANVIATATTGTLGAHTRRTDLIAYRTTDGGMHWTHTLIRLPSR